MNSLPLLFEPSEIHACRSLGTTLVPAVPHNGLRGFASLHRRSPNLVASNVIDTKRCSRQPWSRDEEAHLTLRRVLNRNEAQTKGRNFDAVRRLG